MSDFTPEPDAELRRTVTDRMAVEKPQRVLACRLCSQRKKKCDRTFPCANCVRAGAHCVPATTSAPRQRRRRFPERDLLGHLRHYESLLRQNNITYEPLHPHEPGREQDREQASPSEDTKGSDTLEDTPSDVSKDRSATQPKQAVYILGPRFRFRVMTTDFRPRDFFRAIGRLRGKTLGSAENDHKCDNDDHARGLWMQGSDHLLFFGQPRISVPLSTFHPEQAQIFRLWQIYLDNVNPLLKVTHASTLQARIVDALMDMSNISPTLEALIFSIYCISIMSLTEDECSILCGSPRANLLSSYHLACQQALQNCNVLQTDDLDCLTALYLYLVSVRPETNPRSLSSILAVAIRIAKRMNMHDESSYTRYDALEAEIRRRLWWSLILFDHRICELSDYKDTSLAPTWDCRPPRNVNDLDLRPQMKTPPAVHEKPSEALFAVVRSELADFVRHSAFHINFINPSLNAIAQPKATRYGSIVETDDFVTLEKLIEDKYLCFCDPDNPVHFMTIWTTRSILARYRLLQYYSRQSQSSAQLPDVQRKVATSCALSMLECDTKLRANPLTKRFLWLVDVHIPAIAFNHILNDLSKRPDADYAEKAWEAMSNNYEARAVRPSTEKLASLVLWISTVLHVWEIREALLKRQNKQPLEAPRIVTSMRDKVEQLSSNGERHSAPTNIGESRLYMPPSLECFTGPGLGGYPDIPGQATMDFHTDQLWTMLDWTQVNTQGW
ncbi:hypothetical protein PV11_04755 [Exophiala sideris]|uniref:Zn(2)-C6 fungal-type domain-containing protein n=1 Tax=Exophiala sideris TaxID=1016849 RepID=A0A0D1X4U5_9EURO|nr:hypothetical protein PV11_04755 [Exophiala sideris]